MDPKKEVSAIGYSVMANIGGDRQVTFQHFIAADATDAQVNTDLDRIMRIVDRQRAVYEMPEVQDELDKLAEEISQYTQDKVDTAEVNFQKAQALLETEAATLQTDRQKAFDAAYEAHSRSGRNGAFKPRGNVQATLDRFDAGMQQIHEQAQKNASEREQFLLTIEGNIQRRKDRMTVLTAKLDALRAKVT